VPTRRLHKRQKSTVSVASDPEILPDAEAEEDQDEENDDDVDPNAVFCICRKPDDHTFMIGCEGPCQDWYHGHCVKINESQQERIDVYMCDKCHQAGHGATTYKPLCRRPTCERVAQVIQGLESKYCSRQCGRLFFQENLARTSEREKSGTGAFGPGARLNTQQLAALAKGTNNAKEFHMLGDDAMLLSPPPTVSPEEGLLNVDAYLTRQERFDLKAMERDLAKSLEQIRLTDMRRRLLKRVAQKGEWVVQNLPEQAMTQVSGGKTKTDMPAPTTKIVCCFDNRLSIAGSEWKDWLETDEGKAAFKEGMLETPKEGGRWVVEKMGIDGRLQVWQGLCLTRRCQRHTAWLKSGLRTADDTLKTHHDHISELEAEIRRLRMKGAKRKQGKGAGDGGDIAL
jgi:COMPASS component SPP1